MSHSFHMWHGISYVKVIAQISATVNPELSRGA